MATTEDFANYIVGKIGDKKIATRKMFGEYAVYYDKKVVGLICDNIFFVKITPESSSLEKLCEKSSAYLGSKLFYVFEENYFEKVKNLKIILKNIAKNIPEKKNKKTKKK